MLKAALNAECNARIRTSLPISGKVTTAPIVVQPVRLGAASDGSAALKRAVLFPPRNLDSDPTDNICKLACPLARY